VYNFLMTTLARTKKFHELQMRHIELLRLYSTMSELRLHTNTRVDPNIAKYYLNKVLCRYPHFFVPSLESMRKYFYIALKGYIGAYYKAGKVELTLSNAYSLGQYLNDGKQMARKRAAKKKFDELIRDFGEEINLLKNVRDSVSHYDMVRSTNALFIFSEAKTIEILNRLGDILYLLGYRTGNTPRHFNYTNEYAEDVRDVIDHMLANDKDASRVRAEYLKKRDAWIKR
jgi:hypothetical protein